MSKNIEIMIKNSMILTMDDERLDPFLTLIPRKCSI